MAANFITDANLGAGYGIINVPNITCKNIPSFAIYRASDGLCLSPNGWQNAEIFITPNNWDCHDNQLRLSVDANVVDHLDALSTYKLLINDGTNPQKSHVLTILSIEYSHMHGGQGVGFIEKNIMPKPITEPTPKPTPEPQIPETMTEISQPLPLPQVEQKRSILPIVIAIIAILILAGGIWWYLQKQENINSNSSTSSTKEAEIKENSAPQTTDKDIGEAEKKPISTSPKLSPMQQAREFLQQDNIGQASLDLANKLMGELEASPSLESVDALFLLIEDAAQKNIASAMLSLAKYYDPSNTEPKGSIEADAKEAYAWYMKAKNSGLIEADEYLNRLKLWLEQSAKQGDKAAQDLLIKWN